MSGLLLNRSIDAGWHSGAATSLDQINMLFRHGGQHRCVGRREADSLYRPSWLSRAAPPRFRSQPGFRGTSQGSLWVDAVK